MANSKTFIPLHEYWGAVMAALRQELETQNFEPADHLIYDFHVMLDGDPPGAVCRFSRREMKEIIFGGDQGR